MQDSIFFLIETKYLRLYFSKHKQGTKVEVNSFSFFQNNSVHVRQHLTSAAKKNAIDNAILFSSSRRQNYPKNMVKLSEVSIHELRKKTYTIFSPR